MSRRPAATVYRAPALVLVALLVVGVVAIERRASRPEPTIPSVFAAIDGPTIPGDDALSVVWFCAEGTAGGTTSSTTSTTIPGTVETTTTSSTTTSTTTTTTTVPGTTTPEETPIGPVAPDRAEETILIANLSKNAIDATITVMRGADHSFAVEQRRIEALAQERVPVSDIAEVDEPGVVVEIAGGPAIVEHELRGNDDVAIGPCARSAAREWYFAGGTTARGGEELLTLFNPFGEDAIVDVTFLTASGRKSPGATSALPVPRRTKVVIPVHEQVLREDNLAILVKARVGRIVAERTLRFDGTEVRKGLAVSLGVTGTARHWQFPVGDGEVGAVQSISLANFGAATSEVEVTVSADGVTEAQPINVDVSGQTVERVDLSDRVPAGSIYTVDVRVTSGPPIVAEALGVWAAPAPYTGVATASGSFTVARRWAFATARLEDTTEAFISVINVSDKPITVQLYAYTGGDPNSPSSAPARAIQPGERADFRLSEINFRANQVIVVEADGPIVAARLLLGVGVSISAGVPDPDA